jgi:cell shape-determining protein MreD
MRRFSMLALSLALLECVVLAVNDAASGWHLSVFTGGLFVVYAALELPFFPGMAAALFAGFLCDAQSPLPFGAEAFLFGAAHACVFSLRPRLPRADITTETFVAVLANLGLFLALSAVCMGSTPALSHSAPHLLIDLLVSQVFVALIAPWFFALQEQMLAWAGTGPEWRRSQ